MLSLRLVSFWEQNVDHRPYIEAINTTQQTSGKRVPVMASGVAKVQQGNLIRFFNGK
jgi:hypothetical protein